MNGRFDAPRPALPEPPPSLFDTAPLFVAPAPGETIEGTFRAFHEANPWVYDALVRLARDMVARGRPRLGIGMLFEVLRWQWQLATTDGASDFKLNNNYRSRFARLIMESEPDLAGVFETRALTAP